MTRWSVRYVHKISPNPKDMGPDVFLEWEPAEGLKHLGARLRNARALASGQRLKEARKEGSDRIVAFPAGSIWHSIVLERVVQGETTNRSE